MKPDIFFGFVDVIVYACSQRMLVGRLLQSLFRENYRAGIIYCGMVQEMLIGIQIWYSNIWKYLPKLIFKWAWVQNLRHIFSMLTHHKSYFWKYLKGDFGETKWSDFKFLLRNNYCSTTFGLILYLIVWSIYISSKWSFETFAISSGNWELSIWGSKVFLSRNRWNFVNFSWNFHTRWYQRKLEFSNYISRFFYMWYLIIMTL